MERIMTLTSRKYTYYVDYDDVDEKFQISVFVKSAGRLSPSGVIRGESMADVICQLIDKIWEEMEFILDDVTTKESVSELELSRLKNSM